VVDYHHPILLLQTHPENHGGQMKTKWNWSLTQQGGLRYDVVLLIFACTLIAGIIIGVIASAAYR